MLKDPVTDFCVLMSVYKSDKPDEVEVALNSVINQTVPPKEIVLVVDGPIPDALANTVRQFEESVAVPVVTKYLPENVGLGAALNRGLEICRTSYVARMDSDDYSFPQRFERQIDALSAKPELDLCSSWQGEFELDCKKLSRVKKTPEFDEDIKKNLSARNVISHPTIMFKRASVNSVGGYSETVLLLEDWDLYLRLAADGKQYYCIQEPLVNVRVSEEQYLRRGGWKYLMREMQFRMRHIFAGRMKIGTFLVILFPTIFFRLAPPFVKKKLYILVRSKRQ